MEQPRGLNLSIHHGILLCGILATILLTVGSYMLQEREIHNNIENIQTIYSVRIEGLLNRIFHQTDMLKSLIEMNGGKITHKQFTTVAKGIYEQNDGVRAVQYLPNGVVTYCYPLEGNESAIGNNVFKNPKRAEDAWLAVNTKSLALSGPYELTQGGIGCVARNPIFLTDEKGREYFWGFSVLVLDLEKTIAAEGINQLGNQGYDFQLYTITENGDYVVVAGNAAMQMKNAVESRIQVPHHEWTLALKYNTPYRPLLISFGVFLFGLLLTGILSYSYRVAILKAQDQAKNQFLSNMSHHMRTPLNAVIGFSVLGADAAETDEQKKYFFAIEHAGKLLRSLVNDILNISKGMQKKLVLEPESECLRDFFINVHQMISLQERFRHRHWQLKNSLPEDMQATLDYAKLQQICLDLIDHAVWSTAEGETISLSAELSNGSLVIIVQDDGRSIPRNEQKNMFRPFEQSAFVPEVMDMTGGLALVHAKQLSDLMKGTIVYNNLSNSGNLFTVTIPVTVVPKQTTANTAQHNKENTEVLSGKHILVVEDQVTNQKIIKCLLEKVGVIVDCAENGDIAVNLFRASQVGYYDGIIMDIRMPVMDGLEAANAIRLLPRADATRVVIVALSANAFDDDQKKSLAAGMNEHLAKPINPQKLYAVLASLLKSN
jgi:signal transduction histidine kinase/ActR/RegA family two-component response regulator